MPAVELGNLGEFITPTYFPWFSYGLVVLYLLAGGVFLPFAISLRYEEGEKFRCDFPPDTSSRDANDQVTAKCYKKYDERYNSPVPLYGMLFLSLASVLVICFIYICYMRSKHRSRVTPMMNAENVTLRLTCTTALQRLRRVFYIYLLHLVTRLGLMISITAVSFYPSGFPQEFDCVLPGKQQRNSTHFNASDTLSCRTSGTVSRDKANVSRCFWSINIALIFVMFGEIAYLVGRLSCGSEFTVDRKFMAEYFSNRTYASTFEYREHLKQTTLGKTEKLERFTDCEEERTIDDMFVDLELEYGYGGVLDYYEELFLPNDTTRAGAKTLIFGLAGTGKSLLCQKLLRDWSKKSQNVFDFAFLFKFRCYNQTESLSLRQLLNPVPPLQSELENVIQQLLDNPEKILLIFDGLDEFRPFLRDHESCGRNDDAYANSSDEKMPVSVLYSKLLQGKLLCGATVLTTSRPHVISIEILLFKKIVNIKEFTKEKVNEYVSNYFKQHPDQVAKIKQHIENNPHLLSLCAIPMYCRTLCHQLMKEVKKVGNSESAASLPTRKTEVYKRALTSAVSKHHSEYRDSGSFEEGTDSFSNVEKALEELGTLARRGIQENRTTFRQVHNTLTTDFGLLKQIKDDNANSCFCFIHSGFQDFLAARAIVNSTQLEQNIEEVIGELEIGNTKWNSVIQFVAGLLNNHPVQEAVKSLTSCLQKSLSSNDLKDGKMAVLMMKCLYEYNDDNLTKTAMSELQRYSTLSKRIINLKECEVGPVDCSAIAYVLKHLPSGLQYSVDLSGNFIGELGCKELAKLVQSGGPKSLDLSNNKISDEAFCVLMKATKSEQSNIRDLHISFDKPKRPTN